MEVSYLVIDVDIRIIYPMDADAKIIGINPRYVHVDPVKNADVAKILNNRQENIKYNRIIQDHILLQSQESITHVTNVKIVAHAQISASVMIAAYAAPRNNSISSMAKNKLTVSVIASVYVGLTALVDPIVHAVKILSLKVVGAPTAANVAMNVVVELTVGAVPSFYPMGNAYVMRDVFVALAVNVSLDAGAVLSIIDLYVLNKATKIIKLKLNFVVVGLNAVVDPSAGADLNVNVDK